MEMENRRLTNQKKNTELTGCLFVFAAGALWGLIGLFVKEMEHAGASPEMISFLRVFFAFLIMTAATVWKKGIRVFLADRKTLFFCAALGVVCHGIYNVFYSLAVTLAGVSVSAVLLNIAPVFTLLFSVLLFSERFTGAKAAAAVVNMLGCVLTATNGQITLAGLSVFGILCGVGAGLCYSMTAIIGRFASDRTDSFVMSAYSYLFAALSLGVWMRPWRGMGTLNQKVVIWGFLYALIPTAIGYLLYYCGIARIRESSKVPVIASVESVVATLIGIFLYHEKIGPASMAGIALVLLSIWLMNGRGARVSE